MRVMPGTRTPWGLDYDGSEGTHRRPRPRGTPDPHGLTTVLVGISLCAVYFAKHGHGPRGRCSSAEAKYVQYGPAGEESCRYPRTNNAGSMRSSGPPTATALSSLPGSPLSVSAGARRSRPAPRF